MSVRKRLPRVRARRVSKWGYVLGILFILSILATPIAEVIAVLFPQHANTVLNLIPFTIASPFLILLIAYIRSERNRAKAEIIRKRRVR